MSSRDLICTKTPVLSRTPACLSPFFCPVTVHDCPHRTASSSTEFLLKAPHNCIIVIHNVLWLLWIPLLLLLHPPNHPTLSLCMYMCIYAAHNLQHQPFVLRTNREPQTPSINTRPPLTVSDSMQASSCPVCGAAKLPWPQCFSCL